MSDPGSGSGSAAGSDTGSERRADIVLCPGGPMLLRGHHIVEDSDGTRHETVRPVSAVCRCSKSSRMPWCDGTHQLLPQRQRPT